MKSLGQWDLSTPLRIWISWKDCTPSYWLDWHNTVSLLSWSTSDGIWLLDWLKVLLLRRILPTATVGSTCSDCVYSIPACVHFYRLHQLQLPNCEHCCSMLDIPNYRITYKSSTVFLGIVTLQSWSQHWTSMTLVSTPATRYTVPRWIPPFLKTSFLVIDVVICYWISAENWRLFNLVLGHSGYIDRYPSGQTLTVQW